MKLIIDIPKEDYENGTLVNYFNCYSKQLDEIIYNGTPLEKGHGRLIDAERYRNEMLDSREFDFFKTLDMQPTIVEADRGDNLNLKLHCRHLNHKTQSCEKGYELDCDTCSHFRTF